MAEIRNVNIDREFIVKFGVCKTDISDDRLSTALEELPKAIEEALKESIVEDGEITVIPVKRGIWENTNIPNQLKCSNCEIIHFIAQYPHGDIKHYPNCGAKMDRNEVEEDS